MPNPYFQFKQFIIHQDKCAMKVSTDACILGAWFSRKELEADHVLDIGSGTGLLMLMLAQKQKCQIHGVEIDPRCVEQLKENTTNSKWKERLVVHEGDIRSFKSKLKFDFIISNPPFYEKSLKAESDEQNIARHSKELRLEELVEAIDKNLSEGGTFGLLLPFSRLDYFEKLAADFKFHLVEKLLVRQSAAHQFFRGVIHFSREEQKKFSVKELAIQNDAHQYTSEFVELLKDYYLYLEPV